MNTVTEPVEANRLPSQFQIGDKVVALGNTGAIERVTFSDDKVTYDVRLDVGGEALRNVDSCFVLR